MKLTERNDAQKVLDYFLEICKIPHGSGNTRLIRDYLVEFAKERGLEYYTDEYDNVVIRKPATPGYEKRPAVVFQGHLDMVAEKSADRDVDMLTEGLDVYCDGDFLRARGTTLGGDDGVAIAYALAVLDSDDVEHPDFEAVFTSDEETGLIGATNISPDAIKGRLLINIDSDEEGVFTVGCAGGMRTDTVIKFEREANLTRGALTVRLYGLKGGHSGIEIDKGRGNAIKALFDALKVADAILVSGEGGNADNAIPRECTLTVIADRTKLLAALDEIKASLADIEPDIAYEICEKAGGVYALTPEVSKNIITLVSEMPTGVVAMSADIAGLVETSLNVGILRLEGDSFTVSASIRSSKEEEKRGVASKLCAIAKKHAAEFNERAPYPAWEYREDSHLRDVMVKVYEDMYGKSPEVVIIHAGLECGILSQKFPGLDCVSIGPNNYDIHTTEEHLSISSTIRVWDYLKKVLKEI